MIAGIINRRRPPRASIREVWERALCLAVLRGDIEAALRLVRMYETEEAN